MARCTTVNCPATATRTVYWGDPPEGPGPVDEVVVNHPYCDRHAQALDRPGANVVPPLHDAQVFDFQAGRERLRRSAS